MVLKAGWQMTINGSFVTCYAHLTQKFGFTLLVRISLNNV